jgi:tRNA pseudouridine55 synthase
MVSARHHEGKRLYELARAGITVERQAREVEISRLDLTEFRPGAEACVRLEITCSTGTYIRVLADDLGFAAGTGAFMQTLRRSWVGSDEANAFTLAEAHSLEDLERAATEGTITKTLVPLASGLRGLAKYRLTEDGLRRLRHGQAVAVSEIVGPARDGYCGVKMAAIVDEHGEVVAIAERGPESLRPLKVLMPI